MLNEWDEFINTSNNGTIFQKQSFINYHIDRDFIDNSLIIKNNNQIVALLPAAVKNNILVQIKNMVGVLFPSPLPPKKNGSRNTL